MSIPTTTQAITLTAPVRGEVTPSTFELKTLPLPALKAGQVLLRLEAFSHEPALRHWIDAETDPKRLYVPPVLAGEVVRSPSIGTVIASNSDKWAVGQRVAALAGWAEHAVVDDAMVSGEAVSLPDSDLHSLDVLGWVGLTAYFGLFKAGRPIKQGMTVVVSGAAGGVGSVVVQIAKHVLGARVVGIAGGEDKCAWVRSLGADEAVDYKSPTFAADLAAALPDYADVFFDNVGGAVLDAMLALVKRHGQILMCGAMDQYNGGDLRLTNWSQVLFNRIDIQGFLFLDYADSTAEAVENLAKWVAEGKIDGPKAHTVVENKLEEVPATWQRLYSGDSRGKLISKLA
ncbi:Putative NADP-dependent oxidoreductase YfmJ [Vanrija pseudolonga]|uniref:NADP-dependent oxidoreductase YfmJ n=1 Tax=Vanrija pseudolonga TaxID=143232 RepID=A0AAF0YG25_9TREE|nr:Putative NADP-dependent oxidoreductase YfmJ [Vanrija pseudolonga]